MELAVMRFGGISLPHNPKTLKLVRNKRVNSVGLLNGGRRIVSILDEVSRISGTAELFGEDCFLQYEKLLRLHFSNELQTLALPELGAVRAVLSKVTLLAEPTNNVISAAFEFQTEAASDCAERISSPSSHIVCKGESLWDISYECGISVERLVELNPQIRFITDLNEGEKVRIN